MLQHLSLSPSLYLPSCLFFFFPESVMLSVLTWCILGHCFSFTRALCKVLWLFHEIPTWASLFPFLLFKYRQLLLNCLLIQLEAVNEAQETNYKLPVSANSPDSFLNSGEVSPSTKYATTRAKGTTTAAI